MILPNSLLAEGFVGPGQTRNKIRLKNGQFLKPLLLGTEGRSDSGKTEFALSVPGCIQMIALDRGFSPVFDNPNPPATRNPNVGMKVVQAPPNKTATQNEYIEYFKQIRASFYAALANPDSTVVVMDSDSDFWELHKLAAFGRTDKIHPLQYSTPYAEKKAMTAKAWDSGKIVICTNKMKDEYETVYGPDGLPQKDDRGNDKQRKTGEKIRQGFPDQDYLYQIQIRHLFQPAGVTKLGKPYPKRWGIIITKCKHNQDLVGQEIWGEEACFQGLVELAFPDVPLERWGF